MKYLPIILLILVGCCGQTESSRPTRVKPISGAKLFHRWPEFDSALDTITMDTTKYTYYLKMETDSLLPKEYARFIRSIVPKYSLSEDTVPTWVKQYPFKGRVDTSLVKERPVTLNYEDYKELLDLATPAPPETVYVHDTTIPCVINLPKGYMISIIPDSVAWKYFIKTK